MYNMGMNVHVSTLFWPGAGGSVQCGSSSVPEGARVGTGEGSAVLLLSARIPGGAGSHRGGAGLGGGAHDRGQD